MRDRRPTPMRDRSTPSMVDTFLNGAEARWWTMKQGRQLGTLGLLVLGAFAGLMEIIGK